ncbi:GNAT family N-acetyltransferase [Thalassospira povalilytica]|uniref:GNAT family N-acetyltransferase n=1 Tax=Thalassospira povalilytica TaxID=732237 RepID=UPI001D182CBF|nr:GNAT family N-acetyltransferase [Thalassospira povalilytica]MCC4241928.1 GNAT family N-acetyltransferase [Thalassospira povalilytica]
MIKVTEITLRRAALSDSDDIRSWRNDPVSRSFFRDNSIVDQKSHNAWYLARLSDSDTHMYIAELEKHPVGIVRYEKCEENEGFEVSINLNPDMRGRGFGKVLLRDSLPLLAQSLDYKRLHLYADIMPSNIASIKSFEHAGYQLRNDKESQDSASFECRWPNFDAVVCLANDFRGDGELNDESKLRLDTAVRILKSYNVKRLVTTGWCGETGSSVSLAKAMASRAKDVWSIAENSVYQEDRAKDTVGEAIYLAKYAMPCFGWKRIAIVTGDWHTSRARHVFERVFGKTCKLDWFSVPSDAAYWEAEEKNSSRLKFDQMTDGIVSGDIDNFYKTLVSCHPLYLKTDTSR